MIIWFDLKDINGERTVVNMGRVRHITSDNNGGAWLSFENCVLQVQHSVEELHDRLRKAVS